MEYAKRRNSCKNEIMCWRSVYRSGKYIEMTDHRNTEKIALILNEVPLLCLPIALHTNATETWRRHRWWEEKTSKWTDWLNNKINIQNGIYEYIVNTVNSEQSFVVRNTNGLVLNLFTFIQYSFSFPLHRFYSVLIAFLFLVLWSFLILWCL